jgi:hypothetical protein
VDKHGAVASVAFMVEKSESDPAHFATGHALRIALAEEVALAGSRT